MSPIKNLTMSIIDVRRQQLFSLSVTHPMAMEAEFALGAVKEKDSNLGHERVHKRREQMRLERQCKHILRVETGMEICK